MYITSLYIRYISIIVFVLKIVCVCVMYCAISSNDKKIMGPPKNLCKVIRAPRDWLLLEEFLAAVDKCVCSSVEKSFVKKLSSKDTEFDE